MCAYPSSAAQEGTCRDRRDRPPGYQASSTRSAVPQRTLAVEVLNSRIGPLADNRRSNLPWVEQSNGRGPEERVGFKI